MNDKFSILKIQIDCSFEEKNVYPISYSAVLV